MTLAPVFRSGKLFEILRREGVIEKFGVPAERMYGGVRRVHADLGNVIDRDFIMNVSRPETLAEDLSYAAEFLRAYFFLILFSAVFEHLKVDRKRLDFYAELSYCIMGTIAAADNLFDRESKVLLPLKPVEGSVFGSILQLMCFERLTMNVAGRAIEKSELDGARWRTAHRNLLTAMATIGKLEGVEEAGLNHIMEPEEMVRRVHMVRGGMLFGLVTVAPLAIEEPEAEEGLKSVEEAFVKLGTAFQLVDDVTDFEFDLTRKSHNILAAEAHHRGSAEEKALLAEYLRGRTPAPGEVEEKFAGSASRVLETAGQLAYESFAILEKNGFWFPKSLAPTVVRGIVADQGTARMERLAGG